MDIPASFKTFCPWTILDLRHGGRLLTNVEGTSYLNQETPAPLSIQLSSPFFCLSTPSTTTIQVFPFPSIEHPLRCHR